ncbi:PREDICTED: uncharacterized protein C13G5.2-like [Amphimedon queenslandica]|uniref:Uncharacterized protein n=1 Tax=Amphimedon queenslandica TaxID=400682 RepID=A0A1X7SQY0_AMPQE|nr:PREDICTED: uncharacterized protein C13G5.2-like [Amphimedon queenslandica]|eukprot:XP_019863041.1 PREDICTED: uncharacterized protein C13G5.2-like [Amphimedon queenslandica]
MWKRTVVVLTQANRFLTLGSVGDNDLAEEFREQIKLYKECVSSFISKSVKKEVLENIPYCTTGKEDEKALPTTDDWLKTLWDACIDRCSDETRSFLKAFAKYRQAIKVGAVVTSGVVIGASAGVEVGAKVGAAIGTVVSPGVGTVVGGVVGGAVGGTIGGVGAAVSQKN